MAEEYTRKELLKYAGNISQIAGIEKMKYCEGKASGMSAYRVKNGAGLDFTMLPDRCLDIAGLSYRGVNISALVKNGLVSPSLSTPVENEFDHYFSGGMLVTCGLLNTGNESCANGVFQPVHGRIGISPAEQAYARSFWQGDEYMLEAGATVRESRAGAHNLLLSRVVRTSLWSKEIEITDTFENLDTEPQEYLLLYHYNFGFPFVSSGIEIVMPEVSGQVLPRTKEAADGIGAWGEITEPVDNFIEQCFFHDPKPDANGECVIRLENRPLGIGARLCYQQAPLPVLTEWKSMRSGDYILGIEPGNSLLRGMEEERRSAELHRLEGFGSFSHTMKLGFYDIP